LEPRVEVVAVAVAAAAGAVVSVGAGTAGRDPQVVGQIVATAHAARREPEPVGEYSAAVVGRVVCEQPVQAVLLFAPAALAAEHLLVLEPAQHNIILVYYTRANIMCVVHISYVGIGIL